MEDRDAGTDQGPDHLVKGRQRGRQRIMRAQAISAKQDLPYVAGADPFAFHRKKRQFVHRIKGPQIASELQAIDYLRHGSETDVLGTEIAMAFHHPAVVEPSQEEVCAAIDEGLDSARDILGCML